MHFREFTNGSAQAILDFITGDDVGGTLTSTGGTGFEHFLCGVTMTIDGTTHGETANASVTWNKVLVTASFAEGDPDKLSFTGEVYSAPVYTGEA